MTEMSAAFSAIPNERKWAPCAPGSKMPHHVDHSIICRLLIRWKDGHVSPGGKSVQNNDFQPLLHHFDFLQNHCASLSWQVGRFFARINIPTHVEPLLLHQIVGEH